MVDYFVEMAEQIVSTKLNDGRGVSTKVRENKHEEK